MERNQHASHDTDAFGPGKHGYKTTAPDTVLTPAAMNQIQEEIARAIEGFGVSLSGASMHQLSDLLLAITNNVTLLDAGTPVFGTQNTSHDHPASASNAWKLIVRGKVADATFVRYFSGDSAASAGVWALTWNASWDPASGAQTWSKDDTAQTSSALICEGETLKWYGRASGAGTWNNAGWSSRGTLNLKDLVVSGAATVGTTLGVTGAATVGSLNVTGDTVLGSDGSGDLEVNGTGTFKNGVTVGDDGSGDLVVNGSGTITGGVVLTGEVSYAAAQSRTNVISYLLAAASSGVSLTAGVASLTITNGSLALYPVELPHGAVIDSIKIGVSSAGASSDWTVELWQQSPDFSTGASGAATKVTPSGGSEAGTVTSGSEPDLVSLTYAQSINNATTFYRVEVGCNGGSSLEAGAVEVGWHDPGPRNY